MWSDRKKRGGRLELSEVRKEIDRVDGAMRELFLERMRLADQVARVKAESGDSIYKPDRETAIIHRQTEGMDPALVREYTAFIRKVMEVSRMYQYGQMLELRDCFPFQYARRSRKMERFCVLNEDLGFCDSRDGGIMMAVNSYGDMAEAIKKGIADAGMGVMEEEGGDRSDALLRLLLDEKMYITKCSQVTEAAQGMAAESISRIVTFTDTLEVLPEHNRLCLMFSCPKRQGGLASVLSMIADYGVDLTAFDFCPRLGERRNFFAELAVNMDTGEGRALLWQLSQEAAPLQILGSYRYGEEDGWK